MTPMPQIEIALEGKSSYLRAINGIPDPRDEQAAQEAAMKPADGPDGLVAYLRRRKGA
jgi:hypothetical protein